MKTRLTILFTLMLACTSATASANVDVPPTCPDIGYGYTLTSMTVIVPFKPLENPRDEDGIQCTYTSSTGKNKISQTVHTGTFDIEVSLKMTKVNSQTVGEFLVDKFYAKPVKPDEWTFKPHTDSYPFDLYHCDPLKSTCALEYAEASEPRPEWSQQYSHTFKNQWAIDAAEKEREKMTQNAGLDLKAEDFSKQSEAIDLSASHLKTIRAKDN
jgi:hypothetical protein